MNSKFCWIGKGSEKMNLIKEMEKIIKTFTICNSTSANLTANAILDILTENNLDITEAQEGNKSHE